MITTDYGTGQRLTPKRKASEIVYKALSDMFEQDFEQTMPEATKKERDAVIVQLIKYTDRMMKNAGESTRFGCTEYKKHGLKP